MLRRSSRVLASTWRAVRARASGVAAADVLAVAARPKPKLKHSRSLGSARAEVKASPVSPLRSLTPSTRASHSLIVRSMHQSAILRFDADPMDFSPESTGSHDGHDSGESKRDRSSSQDWSWGFAMAGVAAVMVCAPALLSRKHANNKEAALDTLPSSNICKAVIFTWQPREGCIGHQSMMVQSITGEKLYFSFWPHDSEIGKLGFTPFKFMGLGGQLVQNISGDISREDGYDPDRIAVVYNLDFDNMKLIHDKMHRDVMREKVCYTFFHNTPPIMYYLNIANKKFPSVSPLMIDPFSELPMPAIGDMTRYAVPASHNCTSLVQDALVAGGFPKKRMSVLPWGSSPLGQHWELTVIGGKAIKDAAKHQQLIDEAMDIAPAAASSTSHHGRRR